MPNGGVDCCELCLFLSRTEPDAVRCTIRDVDIEAPHWTYCANHSKHNPSQVEIPVGPVYEDSGEYPYRRIVLHPSPPDDRVEPRLDLLDRIVGGDLGSTSRDFQVAVIQDLGELQAEQAVPQLVDLAMAEPGELKLVGNPNPPETMDLGDMWESDVARVEFVRMAALRALRKRYNATGDDGALDLLRDRFEVGNPDQRRRAHVAMSFILAYIEPP